MLSWVFGNKGREKAKKAGLGPKPSYEQSKQIAAKGTVQERKNLATHEDLEPEILYYFATDKSPVVRRQVAQNTGTPLQADLILAKDESETVRGELARKIGRLVPQLSEYENERVTSMALEVLEMLARDALPHVRSIIAEEIKRARNVPKHLIQRLAEDVEEIVSVPVLEYSPLLSKDDLMEIIKSGIKGGALSAIARRNAVEEPVSDAVVDTEDDEAVTALLENKSAKISERSYGKITELGHQRPKWHEPLVNRGNLSIRTIKRIASFVSASLLEALIQRNNVQAELVEEVRQAARHRIERGDTTDGPPESEPADERAQKMFKAGKLSEAVLNEALDKSDNAFVRHSLVLLSGLEKRVVDKMLNTRNAKGVVTLAWKAGLSMKMAHTLQRKIARIPPRSIVAPKADGGFPLSSDDLNWYIEFFSE
jgi:uncharacterized protein (DUF2336 family)